MKVEIKLDKVWKVNMKGGKFRLGAQCENEEEKEKVMINKKKLEGTEIFINEDLTWLERKVREKVRGKARELREEGKAAVIIRQRKVKTEEGTWTWSEKKERWFLNKESRLQ